MRAVLTLVFAACLEVGGDALFRFGLRSGRWIGLGAGALLLVSYGLCVNLPRWDFGRLMGVYIALFFVVAQAVAVLIFHEKPGTPILVGGLLIVAGGLLMTFWRSDALPDSAALGQAPSAVQSRE
jgi:small multidrug resistance family-3 protein